MEFDLICFEIFEYSFLRWSQFVHMYIRGRGKIGYLVEEKKEPSLGDASHAPLDAENSMVMRCLVHSMEEDISSNYMCYHTAKEHWDKVNQMYLGSRKWISSI